MKEKQCYRPILISDKGGGEGEREMHAKPTIFIDKPFSIN